MNWMTKSRLFLPAEKDRYGNITMLGYPKAMSLNVTLFLLISDYRLLNYVPLSVLFKVDWLVTYIIMCTLVVSTIVIILMWGYRIHITNQHIQFKYLYGSRMVNYEDIRRIRLSTWSLYRNILIYDKGGRKYRIPFGGVNINEVVELLIHKCGVQRCKELSDKMESMKTGH